MPLNEPTIDRGKGFSTYSNYYHNYKYYMGKFLDSLTLVWDLDFLTTFWQKLLKWVRQKKYQYWVYFGYFIVFDLEEIAHALEK